MTDLKAPLKLALTATKAKRVLYSVAQLAAPARVEVVDADRAHSAAWAAAHKGRDAFTAWWTSEEGKLSRATIRPILDELKAAALAADDPRPVNNPFTDDDPSGLTPDQQAELDRAEAEFRQRAATAEA